MSYCESPLSSVLYVDLSVSTPADYVCQSTFLTKLHGHHVLRRCAREYVIGMNPGGRSSHTSPATESLHLMLVIIIIMKKEKRQAKNLPPPQITALPPFADWPSALAVRGSSYVDASILRIRRHVASRSSPALCWSQRWRCGGFRARGTHSTEPIDRQVMCGDNVAITRQRRQVYLPIPF
jgi:hypothetical protein